MNSAELFIIAVGLSMDAFAVSICKGLSVKGRLRPGHALITGLYFGGFQALMPLLGYVLGANFQSLIVSVDHWIAFGLLTLIGVNMIRESRSQEEEAMEDSFSPGVMLPLAVATSIDALAIGVTFAYLQVDIGRAAAMIGTTTFALSAAGVAAGRLAGGRLKGGAELLGGLVLVCMGIKILTEHLGLL